MRKVVFLFLVIMLSFNGVMYAQEVEGYVLDYQGKPVEFASVAILTSTDSTLVGGCITLADGQFKVKVPGENKNVIVRVSHMSYEDAFQTKQVDNTPMKITLSPKAVNLDGITISASRFVQNTTGYSVNLTNSPVLKGKKTADALIFLPGITKEKGVININGLPVSEIYVNGIKITSQEELNKFPANMIGSVKVDYLAGSNTNASTGGGVINISLRKIADRNYYGSLSAEGTAHKGNCIEEENLGGTIYYRYKDLHIYDNLSLPWYQYKETGKQFLYNKLSGIEKQSCERDYNRGYSFSNRLSLTQQLNKQSSLSFSYYISANHNHSHLNTYDDDNNINIRTYKRVVEQEVTTKYLTPLGKSKILVDLTIDYYNRHANTATNYLGNSVESVGAADKQNNNLWKTSLDFTQPIGRNLLTYGGAVQYVNQQFTPIIVNNLTNNFFISNSRTKVKGFTPYVYIQLAGAFKKLKYAFGINWQINHISYSDNESSAISKNIQRGLSPSISLMAPLNKNGSSICRLAFKHILENIPYSAISSTIRWSNASNYSVGNPSLKAPTNDMLMASFSFFKNLLGVTGVYMHSNNNIYWQTENSSENKNYLYTRPVNLDGINAYGMSVELNLHPLKCWMMKGMSKLELHVEDITLDGIKYDKNRFRQYYTLYNSFNLPSGWGGMLNLMLEPTFRNLDRVYYTVYNVTGNIYKELFKDKLELGLSFGLAGKGRRYSRQTDLFKTTYDNTTAFPYIGLSVKWTFERGKHSTIKKITGNQEYNEIKDIR